MRKSIVFAGLLACSSLASAADKPLYQPPPGWVKPAPAIDTTRLNDDSPLLLLFDTQERLADGTVWSYRDMATRMATAEVVAQAGTINLEWQPAKGDLVIHRVEIIRGAQRIDALAGGKTFTVIRREQQLEQQSLDGQLTATLAVEGLQIGDVLHATLSVSRREDALGGAVQDVTFVPAAPARVGYVRTRLLWPVASGVNWKLGFGATSAKVTTQGGQRELLIDGLLPEAVALPGDVPARFRRLPLLETSSFADWPAVSRVMAPLYATTGTIRPGSALAGEVAAIRARVADPVRRAGAALELVQAKVRYLFSGLEKGNYVPQSPEQTWTLRYGDCKAKTLLLLAILAALEVEAEPVLANPQLGDGVPERLPSAAAFNHVLVHATIGGKNYWLDGTGAGTRYGDLGDVPPLRWVLPVRTTGAALLAMPPTPPARPEGMVTIELDQRAGVQLPALATVRITLRGPPAAMLGLARTQGTREQKQEAVQKMVGEIVGGDATVTGYTIDYDPLEGVATVNATSTVTTLWNRTDGRYRLRLDRSVSGISFEPDRSTALWRDLPVSTGGPSNAQVTVRVQLPGTGAGYTLDGDTGFAAPLAATTIRRTVTQAGATLTVADNVTATGAEIAAADVAAMRARVQLARSRLLAVVAPADLPPRWQAVRAARASGMLRPVLAAYTAAITVDPTNVSGYENRANFLIGTYDWKAALTDLDRTIALAPTAARHIARAEAALELGQDVKALADLQAALKLEPQSQDATEALAGYLVDHGRKDEALALALARIDAGGSGRAQAMALRASLLSRAGDRDGALSAIDAAVAQKPGDPTLLNQRCWLKGQLNVQLETALKDCTKAIELSDVASMPLDSRALVYFRLNRLDDALADLAAALEQEPEQAGSLYLRGIIESRQGKAVDAARDLDAATLITPRIAREYAPFGISP